MVKSMREVTYLVLKFINVGEVVIALQKGDPVVNELSKHIPFKSKTIKWKEEIYFETPAKVSLDLANSIVTKRGDVAFWPPGNALCLFYGISQPYTHVRVIGQILGPPHHIEGIETGTEVVVEPYREVEDKKYSIPLSILRELGFTCATRTFGGETTITGVREVNGVRIPLEVCVEDYGIHIYASPIVRYSEYTPSTNVILKTVKNVVSSFKGVRLDLDEEGYLCISSCVKSIDELRNAVEEITRAYTVISNLIEIM